MPIFTIQTPEGKKLRIRADAEQAAISGAQQWHQQNGATINRGIVGETSRAFTGGIEKLKQDAKSFYRDASTPRVAPNLLAGVKNTVSDIGRMGAIAGDALSVVASPITGPTEALLVKPAAKALAQLPGQRYTAPKGMNMFVPGPITMGEPMSRGQAEVAWQGDVRSALTAATPAKPRIQSAPAPQARAPKPTMTEKIAEFDRAGVTPSLAGVQGDRAATVTNTVAENFIAGAPSRGRLRKNMVEISASADRIATGYGSNRGPMIAGENVQAGVKRFATDPSAPASFEAKSNALYDDAFAAIPNSTIAPTETAATLKDIMGRVSAPALAETMKAPKIEQIAKALQSDKGRISFDDLRELRSWVRKLQKAAPELRQGIADADLKRLEGALTKDVYANASTLGGADAARRLQQVDRYYAVGNKRIGTALKAFDGADGAKAGESTFGRIQQAAGSTSSADAQKLLSLKRSLSPDEWGDVAATQIKFMGKAGKGAANAAEADAFSINNFVSNYAAMSPRARKIMFGSIGGGGAKASSLADELDNLVRVSGYLKAVEKGANASRTAVNAQAGGTMIGLAVPGLRGATITGLGGFAATGEMMTNPVAVRAIASLARAAKLGPRALNGQIGRLRISAQTNPILLPVYAEAQRALMAPQTAVAVPAAASEEPQ